MKTSLASYCCVGSVLTVTEDMNIIATTFIANSYAGIFVRGRFTRKGHLANYIVWWELASCRQSPTNNAGLGIAFIRASPLDKKMYWNKCIFCTFDMCVPPYCISLTMLLSYRRRVSKLQNVIYQQILFYFGIFQLWFSSLPSRHFGANKYFHNEW